MFIDTDKISIHHCSCFAHAMKQEVVRQPRAKPPTRHMLLGPRAAKAQGGIIQKRGHFHDGQREHKFSSEMKSLSLSVLLSLIVGLTVISFAVGCERCRDDYDCTGLEICNSKGVCEQISCTSDEDCPKKYVCRQNKCTDTEKPGDSRH